MSLKPGKKKCTLHVCTSCRPAGWPREPKDERPGFQLFKELEDRLYASSLRDSVDLKAAECLSLCPDHAVSRSHQQVPGPIYLATKTQMLVSMQLLNASQGT